MKPKKKIIAYSFECPKCGDRSRDEIKYNDISEELECNYCDTAIKTMEHEIDVDNLPEVGRMVKVVDKYNENDIGFVHKGANDVLSIGNTKEPTLHINIDSIKTWCYLKEDRDGK